nr:hypothetical protein [Tanacetum cinerariifolium]
MCHQEAAGHTKDDMGGLFEMANEELFPACTWMSSLDFLAKTTKMRKFIQLAKRVDLKNKDTTGKKVPNKVLRYFPLIPRLKRMYGSLHTAKHMTWHATGKCTKDGKIGHPVYGMAWKEFDKNNSEFVKEHRNVRLWLVADGFNLFRNLSQSYSMWPVILTTYNTPPWICMKESSFMLTLLIHSPKSPGYLACPTCNEETLSTRVNRKTTYVGHRRFLIIKHHWRNDKTFNGKHPSYEGVKRQRDPIVEKNRSKRSIFYELPYYWSSFPLKHNLDVMHIEQSVLESLLEAILARPEGCLAEAYITEEALTFCSHYLRNVPPRFNRLDINDDGPPPTSELEVFQSACTPKSAGVGKKLDHEVKKKLAWYVLDNSPEIDEYKTLEMAMVVTGHGGDNGPLNDDRLWEPTSIHKNAKGRKKGFDATLIKKILRCDESDEGDAHEDAVDPGDE